MDAVEPSAGLDGGSIPIGSSAGLAGEVFDVLGDRMAARAGDIALFSETGGSFEEWCTWESVAAFRGVGWMVKPRPPYAEVGVTGSRESADLLVFDPTRGSRVLIEMAIVSDWTTNKWIGTLDGDTEKLSRALTPGIVPLQIVLAAALTSPIEVNPIWQRWLGMSNVWNRPTTLKRAMPLGTVGQLDLQGWIFGDSS